MTSHFKVVHYLMRGLVRLVFSICGISLQFRAILSELGDEEVLFLHNMLEGLNCNQVLFHGRQ